MFNPTAWLNKQSKQQAEAKKSEVIQAASQLKALKEQAGWRLIENFMETQRRGGSIYLEKETVNINLFSLPWLFNAFLKYLGVLFETRAYNRIDTYMKTTIMRGEEYARERARQAAKDAARTTGNGTSAGQTT